VWAIGEGGFKINIFDPSTSYNREVLSSLWIVLFFAALIFIAVTAAMTYTVLKFRKTGKEKGNPPQFHGNDRLEVAWTILPTLIVFVIFGATANSMFRVAKVPPGAMLVKITAYQYWWDFEYPELGIRNSNELILPVNKPVRFEITSADVIHSPWMTSLVGKADAIPGVITKSWVKPEKLGNYYGQCAELCGASHSNMRFRVMVVPQEQFDGFVSHAKKYRAPAPQNARLEQGLGLYQTHCAACHTIAGVAQSKIGPDLTFYGNRTTVGAGIWTNTSAYLEPWIKNSPGVKPGSKMPAFNQLTDDEVKALAEYLMSHKVEGLDFSTLPKY
jgi:cytochrome c oxidase subunit 2